MQRKATPQAWVTGLCCPCRIAISNAMQMTVITVSPKHVHNEADLDSLHHIVLEDNQMAMPTATRV